MAAMRSGLLAKKLASSAGACSCTPAQPFRTASRMHQSEPKSMEFPDRLDTLEPLTLRNWCPGAESNHRHGDFQSLEAPRRVRVSLWGRPSSTPQDPSNQVRRSTVMHGPGSAISAAQFSMSGATYPAELPSLLETSVSLPATTCVAMSSERSFLQRHHPLRSARNAVISYSSAHSPDQALRSATKRSSSRISSSRGSTSR